MQEILHRIEDINIIYQFAAIFAIAFIPFLEVLVAVPIGIIIKLPIIPVVLLSIIANYISVMLVVLFSSSIKSRFSKNKSSNKRFQKAQMYFNKYGVPGISLLGPLLGTNHIGAIVCIVANAGKKNIMLWQLISIILWAVGLGILVISGVKIYSDII